MERQHLCVWKLLNFLFAEMNVVKCLRYVSFIPLSQSIQHETESWCKTGAFGNNLDPIKNWRIISPLFMILNWFCILMFRCLLTDLERLSVVTEVLYTLTAMVFLISPPSTDHCTGFQVYWWSLPDRFLKTAMHLVN